MAARTQASAGGNAPKDSSVDQTGPAEEHSAQPEREPYPAPLASEPFVVGIGASAGGLQPLQQFFDHLPPGGGGVSFIVVQHLSPDFRSLMKELLARHTQMVVHQAADGMQLEANAIYLNPPKMHIAIREGRIHLTEADRSDQAPVHYPIDHCFESLAHELGDRAIAVVLSGTGSDGTRGIRAVNEHGGLIIAQDPDTAQFDGMPRSAINTGLVHYVLSPQEIAQTIHHYVNKADLDPMEQPLAPGITNEEVLNEVVTLLRLEDGTDFSHYKSATVARRISRRMIVSGREPVDAYLQFLAGSEEERRALRNDLLIGVTSFFRDTAAWEKLERDILPRLIKDVPEGESLRIWVTACSTGEEVYSLAMLIHEHLQRQRSNLSVKIFATDLDRAALEHASAGIYPDAISRDMSPKRLQRFFVQKGDQFQVVRQLRKMVIFAQHNLISDAPFTRMDLVTCRNVLIYMQPHLQRRVLATLHFALRPKGVLFLGAAESAGELEQEFETLDRKWKLFSKRRDVSLPSYYRRPPCSSNIEPVGLRSGSQKTSEDPLTGQALRSLLHQRNAACLIISENNQLLRVLGDSRPYITLPEGECTMDITRMVPADLVLPLKTAMYRARKEHQPVTYTAVEIRSEGGVRRIDLQVSAHEGNEKVAAFMIVLLQEHSRQVAAGDDPTLDADTHAADQMADLERELQQTRENLQATIEELETTNEEQQATNEELLASNEELQSTNEELHSVNEELYTVNAEYQAKIQELTELNNDMNNLLRSTDIGTIFLDRELHIRKFTTAVSGVISLLEQDIGRSIENFAHTIEGADLVPLTRQVLEDGQPLERAVRTHQGNDLLMRIHPYRTDEQETEGAVITFVDITQLKKTQTELEEARAALEQRSQQLEGSVEQLSQLAAIIRSADESIIALALDGTIRLWNRGAERLYGYSEKEMLERSIHELSDEYVDLLHKIERNETIERLRAERTTKDGRPIRIVLTMSPVRDASNRVVGALSIAHDLTEREEAQREINRLDAQAQGRLADLRQAEEALRRSNLDLRRKNQELEEFVYMVSHDLQSPLVTIGGTLGLLRGRLDNLLADDDRDLIDCVEQTTSDMQQTIDDLLALSRLGRDAIKPRPVAVGEIVQQVLAHHQASISEGQIDVQVGDLSTVHADARGLEQVIDNLVANAIKHGCDGDSRRIEIGSEGGGEEVRLYVRDFGSGIAPENHQCIFTLFHRLDASREGSGVGLAIVKRIIEAHGGRVWVESSPGRGATFWLALPNKTRTEAESPT
jgi:two-component system CheB/CheR fusion protein